MIRIHIPEFTDLLDKLIFQYEHIYCRVVVKSVDLVISALQAGEKSCSTEYLFPRKDGSMQKLQIRSGLHAEEACGGNSRLPKVR